MARGRGRRPRARRRPSRSRTLCCIRGAQAALIAPARALARWNGWRPQPGSHRLKGSSGAMTGNLAAPTAEPSLNQNIKSKGHSAVLLAVKIRTGSHCHWQVQLQVQVHWQLEPPDSELEVEPSNLNRRTPSPSPSRTPSRSPGLPAAHRARVAVALPVPLALAVALAVRDCQWHVQALTQASSSTEPDGDEHCIVRDEVFVTVPCTVRHGGNALAS